MVHALARESILSAMRLFPLLFSFAVLLDSIYCTDASTSKLTDLVTWDKYSLSVNGTRVFIK